MTFPPVDRPTPADAGAPAPGQGPGYAPAAPWTPVEPAAGRRRSRRGIVVAAAATGVVVFGGAGYAVASYLSGGGTQPEDVLPGDAFGFVKIDLDPSAGQKMELMSLLDKFPEIDVEGDDDVRGQLMESLLEGSGTDLDYGTDVQPWLGDRMAVAAVAAEDADGGVAPVLALAVTDEARMEETLGRVREDTGVGFAVRDDYVLITDTQERADAFAAAEETLAEAADFAGDREALGGDQVALVWADLSALQGLLAEQGAAEAVPGGLLGGQDLTGRLILGVHAQDDALEMVGRDFSVSDIRVPAGEPTRLAQDLPEDTLAALAGAGLGDAAVAAWDQMAESGALDGVEEPLAELGIVLPDDLRTMLGTDLVVAAFGDLEAPAVGARVVTEEPEAAAGVLDGLLSSSGAGIAPVYTFGERDYVVAVDGPTADALVADGGLGDTEAFRAAVADPDTAGAIGYVDLGRVIDQLAAQGGETGAEAAKFSAVEALGFSATSTDEGSRIVLRITTR